MIYRTFQRFLAKLIHYFRTVGNHEKLILILVSIFGFALIFIFGFSIYADVLDFQSGGEFVEGLFEEVDTLNPIFARNNSELSISYLLYPTLVSYIDQKSDVLRSISQSQDNLNFFIEIDADKEWSDGTNLSIDDVDFSFQLYQSFGPKSLRDYLKDVTFEIINDKSGVFRLKFNDNLFLVRLSQIQVFPAKWWRKFSKDEWFSNWKLHQVGFYYYLKNWQKKSKYTELVLVKNRKLPELAHSFDKVKFRVYASYITALHSLFLKEIDALAGLRPESVNLLSEHRFKIYNLSLPKIILIVFNKQKVNSAVQMNLDREKINQAVFANYGEPIKGLFSKELREVMGISKSQVSISGKEKELTMIAPDDGVISLVAKLIQEENRIKIKYVGSSEISKVLQSKDYESVLLGIDYGFPPNIPYFWSKLGLFLNNSEDKYLEKQFQNLILQPEENLAEVWQNIEEALLEEGANLPIIKPPFLYAINAKIKAVIHKFLPNPAYRFIKVNDWRWSKSFL